MNIESKQGKKFGLDKHQKENVLHIESFEQCLDLSKEVGIMPPKNAYPTKTKLRKRGRALHTTKQYPLKAAALRCAPDS